jgi:hypothetical protein
MRVKDFNAPTTVFWLANTNDARGQILDETLGNGARTVRTLDAVTGLPGTVQTGVGGGTGLQNLAYAWNKVGSLTSRQDVTK